MSEQVDPVSFSYQKNTLEAKPQFSKVLNYITEGEQFSQTIIQLGILTEQLYTLEKYMVLETNNRTTTNDDFRLETKRDDELIKREATKIERTVLGEARHVEINMSEYSERTLHAVQWLLSKLSQDFDDRRKEAIGTFCAETGLNGIFEEPERNEQSRSTNSEPLQSHLYNNQKMPHVGQL
ncbi:hypothetical protein DVK00_19340 [Haloarcula sp. Atlit-47R]|uniref:hypothetical protein n=1 Tax=Haloarcula sp. Atlit-47R TaxID=2282132 RepID=UPI000EF24D1A|nr:hypothetical protein [Haloarcula sp. Atlit-47R]RLM41409.1 hypothetical protein DVK00_19340 [Haloarcula sp. Atlit-47R]